MFKEMRVKKRKVSDEKLKEYLHKGEYGFLGTIGENGYPYSVPVNYIYYEGAIYFHSSKKGHKIDNIRNCDKVSFSIVTYTDVDWEDMSTDYESVIVFGKAVILTEDKTMEIYKELIKKFSPKFEEKDKYIEKYAPAAHVVKIEIEHMSGKARYDKIERSQTK